jgi:hypothetical protein
MGVYAKKHTFRRRYNHQQIVTKVIFLKHANPYSLRVFIARTLGPQSIIEAIVYNDGRKALIITTDAYRFSKQNGVPSLEDTIKELDRPEEIVPDNVFIYHPKARSARAIQQFLLAIFFDNRYDKDKVTIDPAMNIVIIKAPKAREKQILEALAGYDTVLRTYQLYYTLYSYSKKDLIAFNVSYSKWEKKRPKGYILGNEKTVFLNVQYKWSVAYLSFLASKNRMSCTVHGNLLLQNNKWSKGVIKKGGVVFARGRLVIQQNGAKVDFELKRDKPQFQFKTSLFLEPEKYYVIGGFSKNQKQDTSGWVEFSNGLKKMESIIILQLKSNSPASFVEKDNKI